MIQLSNKIFKKYAKLSKNYKKNNWLKFLLFKKINLKKEIGVLLIKKLKIKIKIKIDKNFI
jgi:hypothetical protein